MPRPSSVLFLILLLTPIVVAGGELSDRWGFGIESGLAKLTGGENDFSNLDQGLGLRLRKGLSDRWSLGTGFFYGMNRPAVGEITESAGLTFAAGAAAYTTTKIASIDVACRPFGNRTVTPWISLGVGYLSWQVFEKHGIQGVGFFPSGGSAQGYNESGDLVELSHGGLTASAGLGTNIFLNRNLALDLGCRLHHVPNDGIDNSGLGAVRFFGPEGVDANTMMVESFVSLTWFFGSVDRDGDGIEDRLDACPKDPEDFDGFEDEDGCPDLDNDNDGILDTKDACQDVPEDHDGFEDLDGCPEDDNDRDGIPDTSDECPDTAEDLDGFEDEDGCPDLDNDNDGVLDRVDNCPNTPAGVPVTAEGCPFTLEIPDELILEGVSFRSGSAILTLESLVTLRQIKESLIAWPDVLVEIRGHTDSIGLSEVNRNLSIRRAAAVRTALVELGVNPLQITAVGYGEDYPIADNNYAAGRAMNRRVELHRMDR